MSFSNIFPGIITAWKHAWLKYLTLLIAWFVLHRSFCCAPLLYGTRIMLQSGPVFFFFFLRTVGRDAIMAYWYNIWQLVLFVYLPPSSRKPGIFHSIFFFFFSIFIQKYIQNSRDNAFKHQINMILTKSICKCLKTWIYVALRFVRKHVQWQWKSLTLKRLMVAKKWQIKSVIKNDITKFYTRTLKNIS